MSEIISIKFKNNEKEYAEAIRTYYMKSKRTKIDIILVISMILYGITSWIYFGYSSTLGFLIGASVIVIFIMILAFYIMPVLRFRQETKFKDEYILKFSQEELNFNTVQLKSRLEWSYYNKVWETKKFYLLFYGSSLFTIIPKRAFLNKEQQDKFRNIINSKIASGIVKI